MDGGSTDNTMDVLKQFGDRVIVFSGPDLGQTDAINKGFQKAEGDIVAWLNSDDIYLYDDVVSHIVAEFEGHPNVDVLFGDYVRIDENNNFLKAYHVWRYYDFDRLMRVCYISQPTVFFRRPAIRNSALDTSLHYGMDIDLWLQLGKAGCCFRHVGRFLAAERIHNRAKTVTSPAGSYEEGVAIRRKYVAQSEQKRILEITLADKAGFVCYRLRAIGAVILFWSKRNTLIPLTYPGILQLLIRQFIRA